MELDGPAAEPEVLASSVSDSKLLKEADSRSSSISLCVASELR